MNLTPVFAATTIAVLAVSPAMPVFAAADDLQTEDDKALYFLGTAVAGNLEALGLTEKEISIVVRGFDEALSGEATQLDQKVYATRINEMAQERQALRAQDEKTAAAAYVGAMAKEEGARTTDSGVVIREITAGTGASPSRDSTVRAHYHGTLRDGTVFDSSVDRGQPLEISLGSVVPCWQEAIPTMKVGGKSKITCPSDLAYGDQGSGPIPGGAALTFEVELLEIIN